MNAPARRRKKKPDHSSSPAVTPTGRLTKKARRILAAAKDAVALLDNRMFADFYVYAIEQHILGNPSFLDFIRMLRMQPVSIETFLDSPQFMGSTDLELWPEVRKAIVEANSDWWKGWDYAKGEILAMGATGCVDMDTEFLTPTGWKRIADFEDGDEVAQYHEDGSMTFVEPTEYVNIEYPMFLKFKTSTFDQLLTPGHRVIYLSTKTGELREKPAEQIADLHNNSKNGWAAGKFIGSYYYSGKGLQFTDDETRLMVAVMADGSFYKRAGHRPNYCIFHLKRREKKDRLIELLNACGITYNKYDRTNGFSDIAFLAPERNKTYEGWWVASQHQLQLIADEVLLWDGTVGRDEFYTRDKHSADFIQHVFTATGRRATINACEREEGVDYVVHVVKSQNWGIASSNKRDIELVDSHDGRCYCFRMPTGMWVSRRNGKVVVTGNTGKSELAKVSIAYHLHILGCMKKPQRYWKLPEATSILMTIQAAKPKVTKGVIYNPLRTYIETMPWFRKYMRPNKLIEAEMYFDEQNIRVVQGGSDADAVLGDALIGGIVDEINFMNVVEKSKRAKVGTGRAGTYDQAQNVYDTLTRRKKSRFLSRGPNVGMFCWASSTRYVNDFTDRRKKQIQDGDIRTAYVYDKAQYDVVPADRFSGEKFRLLVSTDSAQDIRILRDDEKVHGTVLEIPVEYREEFEKDGPGALRDIVGKSANAINPFFRQQHKIIEAITLGQQAGLESFLNKDNVVLAFDQGLPMPVRGHYCQNPSKPRYVHIDLSNTSDRCGVALLRFDGLQWVARQNGDSEALPIVSIEMAVSIEPDHSNEIDIAEVRSWVSALRTVYGYPIKAVSYDGWNSIESRQQWRKAGMPTGAVSVDRTTAPYKQLREAFNDGRIAMYNQPVLVEELFSLEFDETKGSDGKIDHPINGCFIGSTLIATPNGPVSFEEAALHDSINVFTYDLSTDKFLVAEGRNPRVTKLVTELVEIDLGSHKEYCTSDHLILLSSGKWVRADNLKKGDDIKSLQ